MELLSEGGSPASAEAVEQASSVAVVSSEPNEESSQSGTSEPSNELISSDGDVSQVLKQKEAPDSPESAFNLDLCTTLYDPFCAAIRLLGAGKKSGHTPLREAVVRIFQSVTSETLPVIWKDGAYYAYSLTARAYVLIDHRSIARDVTAIYQRAHRKVMSELDPSSKENSATFADDELTRTFNKQFKQSGLVPKELEASSVLVFKNGVLNLHTRQFAAKPLDATYFYDATLTADFKPAVAVDVIPASFKSFLEVTGYDDPDLRAYLVDTILYLLSGSLERETAFFLLGEGANGKSTILSFLTAVYGKRFVSSANLHQFGETFGLEPLIGCRLNVSNESGESDFVHSAAFKAIVTGEPLNVNRKNKEIVTVTFRMKLLFAMNSAPVIADKTEGMYRRIEVLRFDKTIPKDKRIDGFEKIMFDEASEILSWCINDHFRRHGKWTPNPTLPNVAQEWRKQLFESGNDVFNSFVVDRFELAAPSERMTTKDILKEFNVYLHSNGLTNFAPSGKERALSRKFAEALKAVFPEHNFASKVSNGVRYYEGLKLKKKGA